MGNSKVLSAVNEISKIENSKQKVDNMCDDAKKIMLEHENKSKEQNYLINKELSNQEELIQKRLEKRRNTLSQKLKTNILQIG